MNNNITAFLPCRKGSERVKDKNIRKFSIYENGLLEIKLEQLFSAKNIDNIILSSNDERVLEISEKVAKQRGYNRIHLDERPDEYGSSSTSTDMLISYVVKKFSFECLLWTHVTSPFITSFDYEKCIENYKTSLTNGYDSLMTVQSFQGFFWKNGKPLTYDRSIEKWPRTQTIEKIYEIDSAAFIANRSIYENLNDRIGEKPFLYDLEKKINIDIDWPHQFDLAEALFNASLEE